MHPAYPRLFCHTVTISIFWIKCLQTNIQTRTGDHRCKQAWIYLAHKYVNTAGFYSIGSTCKKAAEIAYCSVKTRSKRGFDCFYFGLYLPQHAEGISTQLKQKIREQPTILHYKYNCISIRPESKIILWDKEWNRREIAFFWCLANIIWCMKWRRNVTKEGTLEKIKICFACYKFGCFSKGKSCQQWREKQKPQILGLCPEVLDQWKPRCLECSHKHFTAHYPCRFSNLSIRIEFTSTDNGINCSDITLTSWEYNQPINFFRGNIHVGYYNTHNLPQKYTLKSHHFTRKPFFHGKLELQSSNNFKQKNTPTLLLLRQTLW